MKNSKKTAKDLTIIFSALALLAILCSGVKTYYTSTTDVPKDTYVNPESTPHIEEYVEVESLTAEPVTYQTPEYTEEISNTEFEYLIADDFKLTYYCHCAKCCGSSYSKAAATFITRGAGNQGAASCDLVYPFATHAGGNASWRCPGCKRCSYARHF